MGPVAGPFCANVARALRNDKLESAPMIDAHQHFWQLGRNDCTWPTPDLARIHRDFGPDDLAPLAERAGISATVLVQSQASDRDTDFLLDLAAKSPLVVAVVGWVDFKSVSAPARIAELARHPKMRGLRPMLQNLADDAWILDSALTPALDAMRAHRLSFDALVRPHHLQHLRTFAARHPDLPIVIDHGAKPRIADRILDPWRADMRALALLPNVFCKLSGLVTEAQPGWQPHDLAPYTAHLVDCFGPERLMWGSDWPVLALAVEYEGWLRVAKSLTGLAEAKDLDAVFCGTAARFYRTKGSW